MRLDLLRSFFANCENSTFVGDICRALGGQNVELDMGEQLLVMILKSGNKETRIKPKTLRELCMHCQDSRYLGDICRAVGGQDLTLNINQYIDQGDIKKEMETEND